VRNDRLVRLGYGAYGRAVFSQLSGKPILYSPNGFAGAARQALTKLGVKWEPTAAERTYNEGRSLIGSEGGTDGRMRASRPASSLSSRRYRAGHGHAQIGDQPARQRVDPAMHRQ
jgi:hypothetical protein